MQTQSDKRTLARLPCHLAVSDRGRSAPLGEISNISLDGLLITTKDPLPKGSVVPVTFALPDSKQEMRPKVEVMHLSAEGMGVRFVELSQRDARRLRRYVADLNLLVSHRDNATRLRDAAKRSTHPVTDPDKIRAILDKSRESQTFTLIPENRSVRESARLTAVNSDSLQFTCTSICDLRKEEAVLALHTVEAVSYSFQATVLEVDNKHVSLSHPDSMHYSERRAAARHRDDTGATLVMSLPWQQNQEVRWPIQEIGESGLSFRADPKEVYFWPGTELPNVRIARGGQEEPLTQAIVRHLTSEQDETGRQWLRIGVGFGVQRNAARIQHVSEGAEATTRQKSVAERVSSWTSDLAAKAAYLYHSRFRRVEESGKEAPFSVIHFTNRAGKPIVGLLNRTFQSDKPTRAPVVIVAPGFAGRKETASALAMTLVHNFRRYGRDIAVLRFDGTNNLGESFKEPGCEAEGKHMLKFTVQDGVDDMLGALTWAKNNPIVDPTDIIIISLSFSAISVRRVLTLPEASDVTRWIALMGPPDAVHSIANAMGNSDPYTNFLRGIPNGIVTLFGCLVDGDHYCKSAHDMQVATLEDARRDMPKIRADCTWIVGKQDAFIDAKRVEDIMTVQASAKREIITVDAGHLPRTSDQALDQFALLTRQVWRHIFGRDVDATVPSRGYLAAVGEKEWQRVRKVRPDDERDYWRDYLLGQGGIGFDIWTVTPEYKQLIKDQIALAAPAGKRVLDLGAGTGNVSEALAVENPKSLTALDLVPEALERVRKKVGQFPVETISANIDGSARIAMRRFLHGDMTLASLTRRLPGRHADALETAMRTDSPAVHALLRGTTIDISAVLRDQDLPMSIEPFLRDVHILARLVRERMTQAEAEAQASPTFHQILRSSPGLPLQTEAYDSIVCSLVLSYLKHPDDALSEMYRILAPGGSLVLSTMVPDSEGSQTYVNTVKYLETAPESALPKGYSRPELIAAAHRFLDNACTLVRLEEEGVFHFWSGESLSALIAQAGFEDVKAHHSFGQPPQAVIVTCRRA